ncbi:hypothetical protein Caka_0350 [Coraliomargarita akajimensis DSM 45221]|uniref:Uncharacterized protein n=1 Tax=Coraliomargarita akajimensis (strain DSM 45221 / IAM 15411 / JCM 23193 / KCTC 12865 / 04OKA010-24) TaxID=583355 RepID=D5EMG9_CORAD|nr:hypothetical protein Caka_0350 [Coraliomargarita akajimensis DSM 45221]
MRGRICATLWVSNRQVVDHFFAAWAGIELVARHRPSLREPVECGAHECSCRLGYSRAMRGRICATVWVSNRQVVDHFFATWVGSCIGSECGAHRCSCSLVYSRAMQGRICAPFWGSSCGVSNGRPWGQGRLHAWVAHPLRSCVVLWNGCCSLKKSL